MASKNLFISLSDNTVFVAEKTTGQNAVLFEQKIPVEFNQTPETAFFDRVNANGRDYQVVYCTVKHPFFVLVPEVFFESQTPEMYLGEVELKGKKVMYNRIARNGAVCIYTIDENAYQKLIHQFPNVILRHYAAVTVDYAVKTGFNEQQNIVTVDLEQQFFYMCLTKKTELQVCNKFAFKAPEDVLYFLLYTLEQFNISPAQVQLHVTGMVTENAEAMVLVKEYFEHVILEEMGIPDTTAFNHQAVFFHQDACV